ncbi:hypothetical protein T08_13266 [Trichinella sp. T8]|nr:hypothetical protein T08_13266 [Trichinella sp. T8]
MVPPIADENVEKPVIKDEPKGEKKHSKKIKKKSKKRSKSKKSNKPVEDKIYSSKCENWFLIWIYLNSLTSLNYLNSRDEVQG